MHSKCCPLGEETGKWMSCFHKEFSVFMFDADQKPPCNVAQFKRMTKEMRNNKVFLQIVFQNYPDTFIYFSLNSASK